MVKRASKGGRSTGRRVPPTSERTGNVAAGVVHLVTGTLMTALAGVRDVGAEMGRLAIDAADGAIHAADRITAVAGRVASNLVDATKSGMAGIGGQSEGGARATIEPKPAAGRTEHKTQAARKPLARTPSRSSRRSSQQRSKVAKRRRSRPA